MVKEMAAVVAVASQARGIGYKGDLVCTENCYSFSPDVLFSLY